MLLMGFETNGQPHAFPSLSFTCSWQEEETLGTRAVINSIKVSLGCLGRVVFKPCFLTLDIHLPSNLPCPVFRIQQHH